MATKKMNLDFITATKEETSTGKVNKKGKKALKSMLKTVNKKK